MNTNQNLVSVVTVGVVHNFNQNPFKQNEILAVIVQEHTEHVKRIFMGTAIPMGIALVTIHSQPQTVTSY